MVDVAEIEGLEEIVEELSEPDPTPELKVEEVLAPVVIKAPEPQEIVEKPIPEAEPVIEAVKTTVVPVEEKRIPTEQKVAVNESVTPKRSSPPPVVTGKTKTNKAAIPPRSLPEKPTEIRSNELRFHIDAQKALIVLVIGAVLYLVALTLSAFGSVDKLGGLSIGAGSSVLIIFGAIMIYPSLKRKVSGEVFICPKCHESVEKSRKNCPSCGARFFPED
ncbi:MAG: hypothetical protein E4H30_00225 [Methanomassiliicoccus sp.]|nr:MAG: hypothetical protein E4H30_00225 [Methanomassiliicoccus sp.]